MRAGSGEHGSHFAMLNPRTSLHLGRPSRVQRYSSSMHRAMEEDSLVTRYDDDDDIGENRGGLPWTFISETSQKSYTYLCVLYNNKI